MKNKTEDKQEWFPIIFLHRDDFKVQGYDASEVSDELMLEFAKKIGNAVVSDIYYQVIHNLAVIHSLPSVKNNG